MYGRLDIRRSLEFGYPPHAGSFPETAAGNRAYMYGIKHNSIYSPSFFVLVWYSHLFQESNLCKIPTPSYLPRYCALIVCGSFVSCLDLCFLPIPSLALHYSVVKTKREADKQACISLMYSITLPSHLCLIVNESPFRFLSDLLVRGDVGSWYRFIRQSVTYC